MPPFENDDENETMIAQAIDTQTIDEQTEIDETNENENELSKDDIIEDEQETLVLLKRRFDRSSNTFGYLRDKWNELDSFDNGEQWSTYGLEKDRPKPVTNFISYVRTVKRANLASAIPLPTLKAKHPDDIPIVDGLQKALDHVWHENDLNYHIRGRIDRALLQGTSISHVYVDLNSVKGRWYGENDPTNKLYEGEIKVENVDISNFFPDPDAFCVDDCKYIEITAVYPLNVIKNNPAFVNFTKGKVRELSISTFDTNSESGEIYNRDVKPTQNGYRSEEDYLITLHTHYTRYRTENGSYQLDVYMYIYNTNMILFAAKNIQPACYPFAVMYNEKREKDFYGRSICMDILENQKVINKLQQAAATLAIQHANPQKIVIEESGLSANELMQKSHVVGQVYKSRIPNPVEIIQPMPIPRELFELEDRMKSDIREIVGVSEAYTGNSVGSLTTSTGVNSLIERATLRDKDTMFEIDRYVSKLSAILIEFIIEYWNTERTLMYRQGSDTMYYEFLPIEKEIKDNLEWRIESDVFAKAPTTQSKRQQDATTLMQMQQQFMPFPELITQEEYIGAMDFFNKDEMLQRIKQQKEMTAQVVAQNIIQSLQTQGIEGLLGYIQTLPLGMTQMEQAQQAAQQVKEGNPNGTSDQAATQAQTSGRG